jgi:hypothetical protein
MRRGWMVAALATGVFAVTGCSDDSGGGDGEAAGSTEQTCAAAEQAMTGLGADLQEALTNWDGTPENAGEITSVTDRWGQELRDLAAGSSDEQLRGLLADLAAQLDEFGASWQEGNTDVDLNAVDAALQPLDDRCGFGAGAGLDQDLASTSGACAAALTEAGGGPFDQVVAAAGAVDAALASGDGAALAAAVGDLQQAAGRFAQGFRDIAAEAEDPQLGSALAGIATAVERWADSFDSGGAPSDLSGFRDAVATLDRICG